MWSTVRSLIHYAWDSENTNASQVLLIPFISAGLLFLNRARVFHRLEYAFLPGVLVGVVGVALWLASSRWGAQWNEGDRIGLATSGVIALWLGCFLLFYGTHAFREALFPLLFLAFAIPIPSLVMDNLIAFLRRGSAEISFVLIKMTGTPVYREGFLFVLPGLPIQIAPECSGIRSCLAMLIMSVLGGNMLLETWWRRLLLVVVALPVMLFKNAIRIVTLSLLSVYVNPGIIESRLHREGGIPFFMVALLLIYPVVVMLRRSERDKSVEAET
jgi:exosortase